VDANEARSGIVGLAYGGLKEKGDYSLSPDVTKTVATENGFGEMDLGLRQKTIYCCLHSNSNQAEK